MDLLLAYGAGLLTLINPCVLPILPIVLANALQSSRRGPFALAAGMSLSFVTVGLGLATLGRSIGIREETVTQAAALLMIGFGLILLVPRLSAGFSTATAGLASRADANFEDLDRSGLRGQFLGGMLLGAVWSPCIGPTLGGAISLAWQGENLAWAGAIMIAFALGVSTVMLALGYGARSVILKRQDGLRRIAGIAQPLMGIVFILVGLGILARAHHIAEAWAVRNLPSWLIDLSVAL